MDVIDKYRTHHELFEKSVFILKTNPGDRTFAELYSLMRYLGRLKFFQELSPGIRLQVCRVSVFKHFERNELVHVVSEIPRKYIYILLSGSIGLHCEKYSQISRTTLYPGDPFGEGPLMRVLPEGTELITKEPCEVLCLPMKDYDRTVRMAYECVIEQRVAFLQSLTVPIFQGYRKSYLYALAQALIPLKAPAKTVLAQQGTGQSQAMYFIKSGDCKIFKEVDFSAMSAKLSHGTSTEMKSIFTGTKLLELACLGPGQYFGEMALMLYDPYVSQRKAVSIVAVSSVVELYQLNRVDFFRYITGDALARMKEFARTYPRDKDIIASFRKRSEWDLYKRTLVDEIVRSRKEQSGVYTPQKSK